MKSKRVQLDADYAGELHVRLEEVIKGMILEIPTYIEQGYTSDRIARAFVGLGQLQGKLESCELNEDDFKTILNILALDD